ncbi:MAG: serine hydrolase [Bacteroidota bacterium]
MRRLVFVFLWPLLVCSCSREVEQHEQIYTPFLQQSTQLVDSTLQRLTLDEKIGQLLIYKADAPSNGAIDSLLTDNHNGLSGGFLLKNLPLHRFISIRDSLCMTACQPPFFLTDEVLSLHNQFSDLDPFPLPATLNAVKGDSLRDALSLAYLDQCEALGINMSLTPGIQISFDAEGRFHPLAFVNDEEALLHHSARRLEALQERNILSVANAFSLPDTILKDTSLTARKQLHPYYNLSYNGLSGLVIKNVAQDTQGSPPLYLQQGLEDRLKFKGLMMAHLSDPAALERFLLAGTDLLIVEGGGLRAWKEAIQALYDKGTLTPFVLDEKVRKILMAKQWIAQQPEREAPLEVANLFQDPAQSELRASIYEKSVVLAHNPEERLPFEQLKRRNFHLLYPGSRSSRTFEAYVRKYVDFKVYQSEALLLPNVSDRQLKRRSLIVCLQDVSIDAQKDSAFITQLNEWGQKTELVLINYGPPGNLSLLDSSMMIVQAFEFNEINQRLAAQLLFGAFDPPGVLPMTLAAHLPEGSSNRIIPNRLRYARPEEVGVAAYKLVGIDAIFNSAIASGATPGGQVLVAKDGKIIYSKAFGHHTYQKKRKVKETDVFDLASITKVAATTLAAMKLYEQKVFRMSDPVKKYIMCGDDSPIRNIPLKKLFTHTSGLQPNMPIAPMIMLRDTMAEWGQVFSNEKRVPFVVPVADTMFLDYRYIDSMWQEVYKLQPRRRKSYRYSDVNFNLIQKLIESETEAKLDEYCQETFYEPLNLRHTSFRAWENFPANEIVPTAKDARWRRQLLKGFPHDETAALMGGVSGNAGLFSNATDLAVIMQMLLNGGHYGGDTLLTPEVIKYFTSSQKGGYRGLGFDKPGKSRRPAHSRQASRSTYGHTGFTGTCVWVDPDENLIYVFLANRIHPEPYNKSLFRLRVRQRIHNVIYDALDTHPPAKEPAPRREVARAEML